MNFRRTQTFTHSCQVITPQFHNSQRLSLNPNIKFLEERIFVPGSRSEGLGASTQRKGMLWAGQIPQKLFITRYLLCEISGLMLHFIIPQRLSSPLLFTSSQSHQVLGSCISVPFCPSLQRHCHL